MGSKAFFKPDELVMPWESVLWDPTAPCCPRAPHCLHFDGTGMPSSLLLVRSPPTQQELRARHARCTVQAEVSQMLRATALDFVWSYSVPYSTTPKISSADLAAGRWSFRQCRVSVDPRAVFVFGRQAWEVLTGRSVSPRDVRGAFTVSSDGIPFFLFHDLAEARANRFWKAELYEDLRFSLKEYRDGLDPERPREPFSDPRKQAWVEIFTPEDVAAARVELVGEWYRAGGPKGPGAWEENETESPRWVIDCETSGRPHCADWRVHTLAICPLVPWYGTTFVFDEDALQNPEVRAALQAIISRMRPRLSAHNLPFDLHCMRSLGFVDLVPDVCTLAMRRLHDSYALGRLEVAQEVVGFGGGKSVIEAEKKDILKKVRKLKAGASVRDRAEIGDVVVVDALRETELPADTYLYGLLSPETRMRYCAADTRSTRDLLAHMESREGPSAQCARRSYEMLQGPVIGMLGQVSSWGMAIDAEMLGGVLGDLFRIELEQQDKLRAVDPEINWRSGAQVGAYLFETLKLKCPKTTPSGAYSVDRSVLETLAPHHPVVRDLLALRDVEKVIAYAKDIALRIADDERVHPSFDATGTETGRLSCSRPNLQNCPKTKLGNLIRACFRPKPGRLLIQLDYSQIELRVAADHSRDPEMLKIFDDGVDYHLRTAQLVARKVWGVDPETITKEGPERQAAKCFHPDTEVLTKSGWKRISELSPGEAVIQAIPAVDYGVCMSWAVPTLVFSQRNPTDDLVHVKSEGIDLRVTPDHRMLGWIKSGRAVVVSPEDMNRRLRGFANAGDLDDHPDSWTPDETLLRLAVAIQADGSFTGPSIIRLGFTKQRKIDRLDMLLAAIGAGMGVDFSRKERPINGKIGTFYALKKTLAEKIRSLLDPDKTLPWAWLNLSLESRRVVLEEAQFWDSHKAANWRQYTFASSNPKNIAVLQAIASITNRKTRVGRKGISLAVRDRNNTRSGELVMRSVPYSGDVVCLSVPSSFVLVRDGGVPVITGQCVNFGTLYGMGDRALAALIGGSVDMAAALRQEIFGKAFPLLGRMMREFLVEARKTGKVATFYGGQRMRERDLTEIALDPDRFGKMVSTATNAAGNTPIQGSANYLNLKAACKIVDWIQSAGVDAQVVNLVHDSIMIECETSVALDVAKKAKEIMEAEPTARVKLKADVEMGPSWAELQKVSWE